MSLTDQTAARLEAVQARIAAAARRAGRDPQAVRLVVVTKGHPAAVAAAAVAAGATLLGENYAEEGAAKMAEIGTPEGVAWHMIGHVQGRKARLAARYQFVHSLDSVKLARRLSEAAHAERSTPLPVLLQVNVSGEAGKSGFPAWDAAGRAALEEAVRAMAQLDGIRVHGLMTIPPYSENPDDSRPHFRQLRLVQAGLRQAFPALDWDELSMGMSADFEAAVEEGATLVRVGSAILGARY
jgi:pyridoxal phosphate enzyme (YggS family)